MDLRDNHMDDHMDNNMDNNMDDHMVDDANDINFDDIREQSDEGEYNTYTSRNSNIFIFIEDEEVVKMHDQGVGGEGADYIQEYEEYEEFEGHGEYEGDEEHDNNEVSLSLIYSSY
jgi:hypothetical protein